MKESRIVPKTSNLVLQATNLMVNFDELEVLKGVNLSLFHGEVLGLIGPSGGGKSVLLKSLAGVLEPTDGEITRNLSDGEEVSFMFQEGALFDSISVLDNVAFPLVAGRVPCSNLPEELKESICCQVGEVLEKVGLAAHSHKIPAQLSGGMRRRVSLARALVNRPAVALLDDPTSGLDPVASSVIMKLIIDIQRELGTTLILVSHDLRRLLPICDRVFALFDGREVFVDSPRLLHDLPMCPLRQFVSCRYDLHEAPELPS